MKALFCYDGPLYKDENGNYHDSILDDQMFERYFKVADSLDIVIRTRDVDSKEATLRMKRLSNPKINVWECPSLSSVRNLISNRKKALAIIEERVRRADLVFIRVPSLIGNLAVDVCRKLGKKYLVEVVGCPWDAYWNYSLKGKLMAWPAMKIMRAKVKNAPYVLYVTNKFLQQRYPTAGQCVACSNVELKDVDSDVLERRVEQINAWDASQKFVIGTAAALDVRYKGQEYVIKALGVLKKKGVENIEYQLVGSGSYDYLKNVAKKCGVLEQVKFIGLLPHAKVFDWMDGLNAYVQPSRQEGLPRSVIEAMSRALPCLGAKTAGIPELLDESCIFSNSRTETREICQLLRHLLVDKTWTLQMAEKNYNESLEYRKDILYCRRAEFFQAFAEQEIMD